MHVYAGIWRMVFAFRVHVPQNGYNTYLQKYHLYALCPGKWLTDAGTSESSASSENANNHKGKVLHR